MKIQNIEHLVSSFQGELAREKARNWQREEAKIETRGYQAALEWAIILAKGLEEVEKNNMNDYIFNENELEVSPRNKIEGWADAILGGLAIVGFVALLIFFASISLK